MTAIDFDFMPAEINTTKIHRIKEKLSLPFAANLNFEKFKRASFSGKMSSDSLRNSFPLSTFKLHKKNVAIQKPIHVAILKVNIFLFRRNIRWIVLVQITANSHISVLSTLAIMNFFKSIKSSYYFTTSLKKCKLNLASKM